MAHAGVRRAIWPGESETCPARLTSLTPETNAQLGPGTSSSSSPPRSLERDGLNLGRRQQVDDDVRRVGDHVIGDREDNWVDTDGFTAAGLEINAGRLWRTNIYYRTFSRRGKGVEVEHSKGLGIGVTYRFARVRPPWWKVPISAR